MQPDLPRPFRVPGSPLVPAAGAVLCLVLIGYLPAFTWLGFAVWMCIGLVVYFGYGYQHARVGAGKPGTSAIRTPT